MLIYSKAFVDVGNSNIKYKIEDKEVVNCSLDNFDISQLAKVQNIVITSVNENFNKLFDKLDSEVIFAKSQKKYKNLINAYDDIRQLGVDRWLSLIAVYEKYPKQDILLIDIGSFVTFDVLQSDGKHLGGWIMPGFSELKNTKKEFNNENVIINNEVNNDTFNAWFNGCRLMIIDAINKRVEQLSKYKVIITGGGFSQLENDLNFDYFYQDNLVLLGLEFWHNK